MSKIKLGYGSEYQLLRYLGHHRNYLDGEIMKALGTKAPIQWLDYPVIKNNSSFDGEIEGIGCFKNEPFYSDLLEKWKLFWPQRGNSQNWDGVFRQDDVWYFVEAKARKNESYSRCEVVDKRSREKILKAFVDTCGGNVQQAQLWLDSKRYQLANRLTFVHFCHTQEIKAKLCYICFVSGYKSFKDEVQDIATWDGILEKNYALLSLTEAMKDEIVRININCYNGQ